MVQRITSTWVCFTTQTVIQNGSVFRYQTHTSGHLYIGVAPPGPVVDSQTLECIIAHLGIQRCVHVFCFLQDDHVEFTGIHIAKDEYELH